MKAVSAAIVPLIGVFCIGMAGPALADDDCTGAPSGVQLNIQVTDVRPQGEVALTVYADDPRRFLARRGKLLRARVPTRSPVTTACFWLPKADVYAVAVYHDANRNRDFDRNTLGLPTEGFGFSNDAPTKVGLPAFDAVRFRVRPGENTIRIKMRYLR